MHNIQHFEQRRIDPIPMCPEKLCCVTPLRISGIDPTLIHPTQISKNNMSLRLSVSEMQNPINDNNYLLGSDVFAFANYK